MAAASSLANGTSDSFESMGERFVLVISCNSVARLKNCDFFREDKFKNEKSEEWASTACLGLKFEVLKYRCNLGWSLDGLYFVYVITNQIFVHYRTWHFSSFLEGGEEQVARYQEGWNTVDERGIEPNYAFVYERRFIAFAFSTVRACGSPTWMDTRTHVLLSDVGGSWRLNITTANDIPTFVEARKLRCAAPCIYQLLIREVSSREL